MVHESPQIIGTMLPCDFRSHVDSSSYFPSSPNTKSRPPLENFSGNDAKTTELLLLQAEELADLRGLEADMSHGCLWWPSGWYVTPSSNW